MMLNASFRSSYVSAVQGKKVFTSCYDSSVLFHATYGETYEDSARREIREEIDIEAPQH